MLGLPGNPKRAFRPAIKESKEVVTNVVVGNPLQHEPPMIQGIRNATKVPLTVDMKGGKSYLTGDELPPWRVRGKPSVYAVRDHLFSREGTKLDINSTAVLALILGPSIVFAYTLSFLTFNKHFKLNEVVWLPVLLGLIPALATIGTWKWAWKKGTDMRWYRLALFLFILAWGAAAIIGDMLYWYFTYPFYAIDSMKIYTNVNPAESTGVRLMDAGRIYFSEEAMLMRDMGMSFTNWDTYCVAPITTEGQSKAAQKKDPSQPTQAADASEMASIDIFAVGVNCCRPDDPTFQCGEYKNYKARAGLRLVGEEQRLYFRLAVQQSEAAYNINAPHPIFFYWVEDPDDEVEKFFAEGYKLWIMALCSQFTVNLFFVVFFALIFAHHSQRDAEYDDENDWQVDYKNPQNEHDWSK
eukprot:gnl/TRDRNA2_/TRDRNA2_153872_c0_seq1.p1 gnl/TRDRNA2_/TRDRNA2_153872_c0~~gnl/TRDRNA2_/TRDRNA2_153872_c0_seq1.p1  ORF type:complete len:411 (-),score=91.78 gnl/TRDRNA2_/TRDRNA2_153872_c0_seq1:79-1311(-)